MPKSGDLIDALQADVVHFPFQAGFITEVPSIYQPWDLQHLHLPQFFTTVERERRETVYRRLTRQAAIVVVASKWIKDDVVRQYGLDKDTVAVVNVPPPTEAYAEPSASEVSQISDKLNLPDRFAYYPAQTFEHKNHIGLARALRILREGGVPVHVVCSGRQDEFYPAVLDAAKRLGVDDLLTFVGYVTATDVQVLYRRAAMLVFPSLYEGWGLPIVEAMRAGLPIACSNVTSLPELVGTAAVLFDPNDPSAIAESIHMVWSDEDLASQLRVAGRARLQSFDWRSTALKMRALYRLVSGRPLDDFDRSLIEGDSHV